jgi:hypothetical protein
MAAKGGESRAGLVIFLIVFILLSIALGVTTYYGYQEAAAQKADAVKAQGEAKGWENDANFHHYVADTYRQYLGSPLPAGDDIVAMRASYSNPTSTKNPAKAEEHKKLIDTLDKAKKWDDSLKRPTESLQEEIDRLKTEKADAQKALAKANEEKDKANALAEANKREVDKTKADYQKKFDDQVKSDNKELERLSSTVTKLQEDLTALGNKPLKDLEDQKKEIADVRKENTRLNKELGGALKTIRDRRDEMTRSQATADIDVTKIAPENMAKIVSINGTGDMPYISLGTADNLKRQVTFSVYGKGVDGKPLREPKGKLEVIRLTGEHTAQARVTELRDERRDPILPGDFIYNPAWNPNVQQHVAIVGAIDLTGDHRDSVQDFVRTLKNQNIAVDAYLDMRTKKLMNAAGDGPGEITRRTDLLIVGTPPDLGSGPIKAGDPRAGAQEEAVKKMQEVQEQAEKLGVRIVRLSNFLEMSGFPLPKPLGAEKGKIGFQRNLDAAGSPVERHDKPK